MRRRTWTLMVVGLLLGLTACGGSSPPALPTSTPDATARAATAVAEATMRSAAQADYATREAAWTATAAAEAASLPPCLSDAETVANMEQLYEQLFAEGSALSKSDASEGLRIMEMGIAYGVLANCQQATAATPTSDGHPGACLAGVDRIEKMRRLAAQAQSMVLTRALVEGRTASLDAFFAFNGELLTRANTLMVVCGFAAATPVASPIATPRVQP